MRERLVELARFGSVGALAFVVDVGLFNVLRYGPGELLEAKPLTAKVISVAVATVVAWLGNRRWTFASRTGAPGAGGVLRQLLGFAVVNVGGMVIAVGCLAFSHYVLGLTSPLADNVAANVVGLALGTAFRYLAYSRVVFRDRPVASADAAAPPSAPLARRDERTPREHEVRVERLGHTGEEHREHGRAPLGELEPSPVGGDEVARKGQAQAGALSRGDLALEDPRGQVVGHPGPLVGDLDHDGPSGPGGA